MEVYELLKNAAKVIREYAINITDDSEKVASTVNLEYYVDLNELKELAKHG